MKTRLFTRHCFRIRLFQSKIEDLYCIEILPFSHDALEDSQYLIPVLSRNSLFVSLHQIILICGIFRIF